MLQFQFTPLREGRQDAPEQDELEYYFNSRPSARGDAARIWKSRHTAFQFTPLREGRRFVHEYVPYRFYFNSRPSARGDPSAPDQSLCRKYFNSRPSARGDRACSYFSISRWNFNSRPSARGDVAYRLAPVLRVISIHAPPRGATRADVITASAGRTFQFTPLREGRPSS